LAGEALMAASPAEARPVLSDLKSSGQDDRADEEISLVPLWHLLGRYWRVIAIGIVLALAAYVGGVLILRASSSIRVGSVGVRFFFQGVDEGRYPNGSPFSPQDLVATPVLEEVYGANEVERFTRFDRFARNFLLAPNNLALSTLEAEYSAKLHDPKLSVAERQSLEQEFRDRVGALRTSSYRLAYHGSDSNTLPPALMEKVLLDVPLAWARYSAEKRHVLAYDVPLTTATTYQGAAGDHQSLLLAAENLRTTTQALGSATELVQNLPGANVTRDARGATIRDLALELAAFDRVVVGPTYQHLLALAYRSAPAAVQAIFDVRRAAKGRSLDLARLEATSLEESFARYTRMRDGVVTATARGEDSMARGAEIGAATARGGQTVVAQLSDGFLQQLMRTSEQSQDVRYRQRLNDEVIVSRLKAVRAQEELQFDTDAFEHARMHGKEGSHESQAAAEAQARVAIAALGEFSGRIGEFYRTVSERNLSPESQLYRIDSPFALTTQSLVGTRPAALGAAGVAVIAFLAMLAGCALHQGRVRRRAHLGGAR